MKKIYVVFFLLNAKIKINPFNYTRQQWKENTYLIHKKNGPIKCKYKYEGRL